MGYYVYIWLILCLHLAESEILCVHLAESGRLHLHLAGVGYYIYTWLPWGRCKPHSAWLQSRAECGLHSVACDLPSGTQRCGLKV